MEIALWMRHSEERSTGRSEGSQTAFWDGVQPPTRQMCCAALSLPPTLSGSVFVGETPSWVCRLWCTVPFPCRVNHIFSPSIQFRSAAHRYLETSASALSGEPRSPVGGWIRVYKTNWDSGWIYRHKVDVWLYNSLHGTRLACPRLRMAAKTNNVVHRAFETMR